MPLKNQSSHRGFGGAKGPNHSEQRVEPDRTVTQSTAARLTGPMRIHQAAKRDRSQQFDNLLHHITPHRLLEAYQQLNKRSAKGVDGISWAGYGVSLENRLADLHKRIHTQRYKPQPVKRIWLPKANGEQRPIGITSVEDKIVQQALVWILEAVYEADFLGFSYGFRPQRSQHQALDAVYVAITQKKVSWVLDADFSKFFDTLQHDWLMRFLGHRVRDKRLLLLIKKIIKAGVVDQTGYHQTEVGTPQGAVISPLLANVYLHYVLDIWANRWRKTQAKGECYLVRYADDTVFGFQYRTDGENFYRALSARMEKFGLSLNPSKTKLIEFGRFAKQNRAARKAGKPDTFDFLGFTHICSHRWSDGRFKLLRKTIPKKMTAKLHDIKQGLRKRINLSVYEQGQWLLRILQGHYNYFAVPDNLTALDRFKTAITRMWFKLLRRRSQKSRVNWQRFTKVCRLFLPNPKILHPYPVYRFGVR